MERKKILLFILVGFVFLFLVTFLQDCGLVGEATSTNNKEGRGLLL